jgi:uncharacterized membrane protein
VKFDTSKNLGGVGALLIFVSVFIGPIASTFGGVIIALIGFIIMLIGVKGLADYYKEAGIFNNILYGTIAGIVGVVVAIAVGISVLLTSLSVFLYKIFPGWNGDWTTLPNLTPSTANLTFSDIIPFFVGALSIIVILFASTIIVALLYRRSLSSLRNKSGIGLFGTAGILLLIGAILTIIIIGYLLVWIAILLLAVAFFQLRPQPVQPMPAAQTAVPPQTSV